MADYDLTTTEEQYTYPPSGGYTILPSDWSTIDFGMTLAAPASITAEIDELILEVTYTPASAGIPVMFLGENF